MRDLSGGDVFQVRASSPYSPNSMKIVTLMYQPIIGSNAMSIYNTLWYQLDSVTLTNKPSLISYLARITTLEVSSIESALEKLEALCLIQTYKKKDDEHRLLIELKLPLSPYRFVNNQVLNTLLFKILGKDEYNKVINHFRSYDVNKNDYENISKKFKDIFDINLNNGSNVLCEIELQNKEHSNIEDSYSLDLFYANLSSLQLSKKNFTSSDEKVIKQLGLLYKINALDMQDLVKESMDGKVLNQKSLIVNCRNYFDTKMPEIFKEIHHKQAITKHSNSSNKNLKEHIKYLESITPYELLKDKQGGKEPLKRDLQVIESVLTNLELEPGVMNVLIELTLSQCDNALPRAFVETRASQWKRKNIETVEDAMKESKEYIKYRKKGVINVSDADYLQTVEDEIIDDEDTDSILSSFD
ncbi:MAG: DnaD domain protein [Thomasclavelia sp.]|nr:DnaD domain protein [Thomasclavelia sp.]